MKEAYIRLAGIIAISVILLVNMFTTGYDANLLSFGLGLIAGLALGKLEWVRRWLKKS